MNNFFKKYSLYVLLVVVILLFTNSILADDVFKKYKEKISLNSKNDSSSCFEIIRKVNLIQNGVSIREVQDTSSYTINKYYSVINKGQVETYYFDDVSIELHHDTKQIVMFSKAWYNPLNDFLGSVDLIGLKYGYSNSNLIKYYKEFEKCLPPMQCKVKEYFFNSEKLELDSIKSEFVKENFLSSIIITIKRKTIVIDNSSIRTKFLNNQNKLTQQYSNYTVKDLRRSKQ